MATSGYVGEIQPAAQPQGTVVAATSGQPDTSSTPTNAPQFLAEIQTTVATPTIVTPTGQTTPTEQTTSINTQKPAAGSQSQSTAQTQTTQTQYVTAEIQGSPTQSGNAQGTPQYIVVTVTGKCWCHTQSCMNDSSIHFPDAQQPASEGGVYPGHVTSASQVFPIQTNIHTCSSSQSILLPVF